MDSRAKSDTARRKTIHLDDKLQQGIANILRFGVLLAATVVLLGGLIYLVKHGLTLPDYSEFKTTPMSERRLEGILGEVFRFRGQGLIQFGLILLIITPIARVAFSLIMFSRQRDHLFTAITLAVLVILLFSLFGVRV